MSRIGGKPVEVPDGVTVQIQGSDVSVKGPKGELSFELPGAIAAAIDNNTLTVTRPDDSKESKSLHGLSRSLIANMVVGVKDGYSKQLRLEGVGFKAAVEGKKLALSIGFSGPKYYDIPEGIDIASTGTIVTVSGACKQLVGNAAARIRSYYPPEPYKGKGIRYTDEHVRRKQGKTVA